MTREPDQTEAYLETAASSTLHQRFSHSCTLSRLFVDSGALPLKEDVRIVCGRPPKHVSAGTGKSERYVRHASWAIDICGPNMLDWSIGDDGVFR